MSNKLVPLSSRQHTAIEKSAPLHRGTVLSSLLDNPEPNSSCALLDAALTSVAQKGLGASGFEAVKSAALGVWHGNHVPAESVFRGTFALDAALLVERLAVVGFVGETLAGIALVKAQVDALVRQHLQKDSSSTCSLADACVATAIDRAAIGDAIAQGYLAVLPFGTGPVRVLNSSVKAFNDRYASVSRLAKERDTSPRHLMQWCRENGFSAIELSRGDGAPAQPVLLRDEAAAAMFLWEQRQKELSAKTYVARRASHEDKLRSYLDSLDSRGEKLPRRAGQPNKAVIARACGFGRQVFEQARPLSILLTDFSQREIESAEVGD